MNSSLRRIRFKLKNRVQVFRRNLKLIPKSEAQTAADRERTFSEIYRNNEWGSGDGKFFSGVGSRGEVAEGYIKEVSKLLTQMKEESGGRLVVVDIGCGDFHVGSKLLENVPGIEYIGCDIVADLISSHNKAFAQPMVSFREFDIVRERPVDGDVYLVRQVLQHLSNDEIEKALQNLQGRTVIVTESHPIIRTGPPNPDKITGKEVRFDWWTGVGGSVELSRPPFNKRTLELFRFQVAPNEIVATEQILTS